jgi:hypothetical protein
MAYRNNFDYSRLIWPAVIVIVIFLLWKFGKGLFTGAGSLLGKNAADTAADEVVKNATAEIDQGSADVMACGLSYAVMAKNLYDVIYGTSFLGAWRNVDEETLGNILSAVQPQEYTRLTMVYWDYRKSAAPWWQINSQLYTFSEDIRRTLSASEIKKYCPNLPL